jgi:hypothetical protein
MFFQNDGGLVSITRGGAALLHGGADPNESDADDLGLKEGKALMVHLFHCLDSHLFPWLHYL